MYGVYKAETYIKEMDNREKEFEQMAHTHKDVIYTVCYMFSRDEDEVADLFQQTLINMWKGLLKTNNNILHADKEGQRNWTYRVTLNTCISCDRKKNRERTTPLSMNINLFDENDTRARQADMLHKRISALQPFDRAIVLLWLEDISYDEIGSILGISAKNVSVRLVRIKEQLKKMNNN